MRFFNVRQLSERLKQADPPVVLDVREPMEIEIAALPGTLNIPMGEIPERIEELPRDKEIVVICHHGIRSAQVVYFLEGQGFDKVYNLNGGIDAWSRDVDPAVPFY